MRIPEKWLIKLIKLGGLYGGYIAIVLFKHKCNKKSFLSKILTIKIFFINILMIAILLVLKSNAQLNWLLYFFNFFVKNYFE